MKIFVNVVLTIAMLASTSSAFGSTEGEQLHPKKEHWAFDGMLGKFDQTAIKRGFEVYKNVCSACHSLSLVAYRNLAEVGFTKAEIATIAAEKEVTDGPNDDGEMFTRPAKASDRFVAPYANEKAARAANNGAFPPDLSLMIKARHDGANYVHSLLTGFAEAPKDFVLGENMHYNPYFPGRQIAMAPPLSDDLVSYSDGTKATVDQMARDVVNFLQWAAEPEMEKRKLMGIKTLVFLSILTGFYMIAKNRIWARLDNKKK